MFILLVIIIKSLPLIHPDPIQHIPTLELLGHLHALHQVHLTLPGDGGYLVGVDRLLATPVVRRGDEA